MNRKVFCVQVLIGMFFATASASGAFISISFSGPGGTGSDGITSGNLTEPVLNYTSVNFIDVTMTVDSAGTYTLNEAPSFGSISNHTGQSFVAFDLHAQPTGTAGGAFVINSWSDGTTPLPSSTQTPLDINFFGGSVPDNTFFEAFGNFTTANAGTFIVRETPLAAPEPSTMVFLGLGALRMMLVRRRRN